MEIFRIQKDNGHFVSCVKEIPPDPRVIVIAIHGFSSSRDCATYQMLLRRLPPEGCGVIGIELPGHGSAESSQETLRIENALESIAAAENYAAEHYPGTEICYFASSFGAYLTGLYLTGREHRGRRAFFRSAAVNMPSLFLKEHPTEESCRQREELREKGWFDAAVETGKPVRITREMLRDLEENDLFVRFDPSAHGENRVMMVHGAEDSVIDPEAARAFAERFRIPIRFFENEGHSLGGHPETPDRVADLALAFFTCDLPENDLRTETGIRPNEPKAE